jgi:hypothetical protein
MTRRNWKRIQPTSLRNALELCKDYARERKNLSVERIADQMGLSDHWTIYKWLQNGRIPANLIRPFEAACGIDYVTRWLAASAGRLLIDIPTGRGVTAEDILSLHSVMNAAATQILDFYEKTPRPDANDVLAAIQGAMQTLAWHRCNVEKHLQPELDFQED